MEVGLTHLVPYEDNPVPFDEVVKRVREDLNLMAIEIGAFKPHIDINDYPMKSDRDAVKDLISSHGLEVSGLAADFWSHPGPATDEAQEDDKYFKLFKTEPPTRFGPRIACDTGRYRYRC